MILAILACKIREASNKYGFLTELSSALLCSMLNRNCSDAEREREREREREWCVCCTETEQTRRERKRCVRAFFLRTINAARIFCLTSDPTRSWRNGAAQCYQLSNISDPFRNFFPFKKCPNLISFLRITGTASLSLSASARAQFLFKSRQRGAAL